MGAVLPTSAKRTNKGCFCREKAFTSNNNATDWLTASWFAIEKQENERNVGDPEVSSSFSLRGRRVVELLKCPGRGFGLKRSSSPHVHLDHVYVLVYVSTLTFFCLLEV